MRIKESQFLIESGNLLGSESLVHSVLIDFLERIRQKAAFFGKNSSKNCNVYLMQTEGSATLTTKKLKFNAVFSNNFNLRTNHGYQPSKWKTNMMDLRCMVLPGKCNEFNKDISNNFQ